MVRGEAMEASKRRRNMFDYRIKQLSKGSSEGSGIILVAQAAHFLDLIMKFKTSPMMRKTKLRKTKLIQSMMDVPIHQEDPTIQITPPIDIVILMVIEKTASTPTPPTTQAQVQMCSISCWKDSSRESWNALLVEGK
ncbi:hypothetical protein Tco_1332986 [Tanacetum coccineum]